jgi:nucleoside phosphorylase
MAQTAACVARLIAEGEREFLLAGIAGAYNSELAKGDVVAVAEERVAGLPMQFSRTYRATFAPEGLRAVSSNTVSACGAEACGAEVENMEGASLYALCEEFGAECCQVRAISNMVGEPRDEWDIPMALENLARAVLKFISR